MRRRIAAASVVLAALATGPGAGAAAPWSAPRPAGPAANAVSEPALAFAGSGSGLLSWRAGDPASPSSFLTRFAAPAGDGTVADRGAMRDELAVPPLVSRTGRVILVRQRRTDATELRTRFRLGASFGSVASPSAGRVVRVARFLSLGRPVAAAATPRGRVAIAWVERHGAGFRLRLREGGPRGFAPARDLGTVAHDEADSRVVALAAGRRRDLVVAYTAARRAGRRARRIVAVRARRPGGRFGRPQRLGPHAGLVDLVAAEAPSGRAVIAWASQDGGIEAEKPYVVRAAVRPAGRRRFSRARVVDPGVPTRPGREATRPPGHLALAMSPAGAATLAWSNVVAPGATETYPVRTTSAGARGGFGSVAAVGASGAVGDVDVVAHGAAIVTWATVPAGGANVDNGTREIDAALRPPGATAFGPAETVASFETRGTNLPVTASDPASGRPLVAWPDAGPLFAHDAAELRFAIRDG